MASLQSRDAFLLNSLLAEKYTYNMFLKQVYITYKNTYAIAK